MTPPSAKPEASVPDANAADTVTEPTELTSPEGDAGGAGQTALGPRRRAALELRVSRRRVAGEGDEAEGAGPQTRAPRGEGVRGPRVAANAGTRQGPRGQQRAARGVQPGPEPVEDSEAEVAAAPEQTDLPVTDLARIDTPQSPAADTPDPSAEPAPLPVAATPPMPAPIPAAPEEADEDDGEDDRSPGPGGRRRGPRADKRNSRTGTRNDASNYVVAPAVGPAQMRVRHYGVIAMFLLFVLIPTISYSWYLWTHAADQYESNVGFGSRTEEAAATFDFLGALGGTTSSGSKDMDILNQFIISQELVAKIDAQLDLKTIYSKAEDDPLNAFYTEGTIEDLVTYWQRMVLVDYDNGTGLMNLRVFAFDPVDAQKIAQAVLVESTSIINELSKTAQEDTTRYSKEALTATEAKLAEARLAVLDFQVRNRIVDPSNVIANQLSVVSTLNQQLAGAQIELDMLAGTVAETDPRVTQLTKRIEVIRNRIAEEQSKVGASDSTAPGFAKLMAEFERLKVDQDFAQQAYLSALAAHDQALTDAQHKTRYLATYVEPTLAEASTAPNRPMTAALVALIGFLTWAVVVLVYYALRDRR